MVKRRILLLGGNYFPEPTGIGKYNGEMIKWLTEQGNICTVITTYPYYPEWKVQEPYSKGCLWFKTERILLSDCNSVKVIRCPHYVPKKPSGIKRVISDFSFFCSAYLVILLMLFTEKFDYVITVAPPFEIGLLAILYKKVRGCKFLYHIQDLQIDAARALAMIKCKSLINIFLSIEKFIIKRADWVSTISKGMLEKVKLKGNKDVILFPNWVNTNAFYPLETRADIKCNYGFKATDKIILYSGAIGHKQGLEAILHSAKILENLPDIKFAICGSGPYKEHLIRLKDDMNLKNVFFLPLQPLRLFNSFLNLADVHLVLQKAGASDLVLPSKLSTILAVGGVAIVTANKGTSLYDIMNSRDMGILIDPENTQALVDSIINMKELELKEKGKNARNYAEKHLTQDEILNEYFTKVFDCKKSNIKVVLKKNIVTA